MKTQLEDLLQKRDFTKEELVYLLSLQGDDLKKLFDYALKTKLEYLDNNVHLRGLIEYSNICKKNCLYCGLRASNINAVRYTMSDNEVFQCIETAKNLRYGSVALQTGERTDKDFIDKIEYLIKQIKLISNNKIGITLSCGEQNEETFKRWKSAGAHRYLLRIETSNEDLYYKIHPKDGLHSFSDRINCIDTLIKLDYQTGTGCMVGLPFQTKEHLAEDLLFFKRKNVAMVGLGPFIPHSDTPLWQYRNIIPDKKERMRMTLKMIAVLRIMMPEINMVSATANQTIDPLGREKAVVCGANVLMPNLTPTKYRGNYMIYPDKACVNDTPEDCYSCLDIRMKSINHKVLYDEWGDSPAFLKNHKNTAV